MLNLMRRVKSFGLKTWCFSLPFCATLLLSVGTAPSARAAGFIGYYTVGNFVPLNSSYYWSCDGTYGNFTLTETGDYPYTNGCVLSPDTSTLLLTGTNDGSGVPGATDFTIPAATSGIFQFDYVFNTLDYPTYEYAGYLLSGTFYPLANTDGQSGSVDVPVQAGQIIGFSVGSLYSQDGLPGTLTVTDFNAPTTPEPGTLTLLLIGVAALAWWSRRTGRARRVIGCVVAVVCISATARAQQSSFAGTSITGQVALAQSVNLRQQAQTNALTAAPLGAVRLMAPGGLPRPALGASKLSSLATVDPPLQSLSVVQAPGTSGFNALSHLDQRNAYGGNQFSLEPPNQSIAVGNGYVLEGVNDAIQIYTTSGVPVLPMVLASNQAFGLAPAINWVTGVNGVYLTDMRVFFDQGIGRWFIAQRSQDNDVFGNPLPSSHLYLAVSQTSDPTGTYNIYIMNTTNAAHPGCPCIDDYLQIGADQYGFHIAWDEYNASSLGYVDASILALSKSALAAGTSAPAAFQFLVPYLTGFEFAIQPASAPPGAANLVASGGVEYLVSTSSGGSQIALWAMSNTSSLATSTPNLTLAEIVVPVLSYSPPGLANQPNGYAPLGISQGAPIEELDGGDTRVQALVYAAGRLYLTFPCGLFDQNNSFVVGGAYIVLSPAYINGVLNARVINQGYLMLNGNHLLRPAIAVNAQGNGAIAVTLVGKTGDYFPSAAFIPFQTASTPGSVQIAALGALPEDGFTGYPIGGGYGIARWGDYNSAVTASDGSIWMTAQYIGNYPRTEYANWNTYISRKQP